MANILFAGFLYSNAGVAIQSAVIDLYDRNTTTPSRANTTSDANGYWAISHATQGRFDVQIVSGTTTRRRKYDDSIQLETLEVAVFRMRNPADTFEYDIVPAAITASRQLNLPLLAATDTIAVLAMAQTFLTGAKTFNDNIFALRNPADTFSYNIRTGAITAARDLTVPLLTANDTLVVETLAQTLANKTLTTPTIAATGFANATHAHAAANSGGQVGLADTTGTLAVARGGTGLTALGTALQVVRTNAGATALEHATLGVSTLIREGGNTTEATTTSTSEVDLLTASSLTIAATEPTLAICNGRYAPGTGRGVFGLKLNATIVRAVSNNASALWITASGTSGAVVIMLGARVASYLRAGCRVYQTGAGTLFSINDIFLENADMPTAEVTSFIMTAVNITDGTTGADELQVYSLAAS